MLQIVVEYSPHINLQAIKPVLKERVAPFTNEQFGA